MLPFENDLARCTLPTRTYDLMKECERLNNERVTIIKDMLDFVTMNQANFPNRDFSMYNSLETTQIRFRMYKDMSGGRKRAKDRIHWGIIKAFQNKFNDYRLETREVMLPLRRNERPQPDFYRVTISAFPNGHVGFYFDRKDHPNIHVELSNARFWRDSNCGEKVNLAIEMTIERLNSEVEMIKKNYKEFKKETEHLWVALKV